MLRLRTAERPVPSVTFTAAVTGVVNVHRQEPNSCAGTSSNSPSPSRSKLKVTAPAVPSAVYPVGKIETLLSGRATRGRPSSNRIGGSAAGARTLRVAIATRSPPAAVALPRPPDSPPPREGDDGAAPAPPANPPAPPAA